MTLEARVRAFLDRLERDDAARRRLFVLLWYVTTGVTVLGFVLIALLLRRQGVL